MTVRVALQSIEKASLLLDNEQRYGSVGRGALIYIAFIGAVSEDALKNAVDVILTANVFHNLSSSDALPRSSDSLSSFPSADVLIVPQASLGGKLKGRNVQFHALVGKSEGELLYNQFCQLMRKARGVDSTTVDSNGVPLVGSAVGSSARVINGTWGNRQGLRLESQGPLTHVLDL
ncbi:D-Tyr-tRNA(Tyr) deacylase, putative [Trypanosoma equiperdum]|uniref:D-Tyr-tRNA(Tyr) deacylase n=2 Tax=Trypanozoon TaxID=39700 RepID=Q581U3_TRYB2|nr:hypothetical protein, conserved [Trypanosoma brucei brucei TREU927]AAX79877.1 hypothetical protein, conserved [Trypanosoma brucei]AAZ10729.1 hypothetical protein, conserved [Trypanosoma brucei brucei TREU927]SCU66801.1 D-Tyr-tRNA(Tyr) deacylase, putative [Trypanosoma equiperdum]